MDEQPITRADLDRVTERIDRVTERIVDAFTANLSDLRNEMVGRFEKVDERFDAVLRRLDRIETNVTATQMQTMGMSKSLTDAERLDTAMLSTQSAQQRAIDDLAARVTQIERRLAGQQSNLYSFCRATSASAAMNVGESFSVRGRSRRMPLSTA